MRAGYLPWLFDNYDAWQATIQDSRYKYDMPFSNFMSLYKEHRNGDVPLSPQDSTPVLEAAPAAPEPENDDSAMSQILSQDEIDALFSNA
jgi:hypothetical protein